MKKYTVKSPARFIVGGKMWLSNAQIALRAHQVKVLEQDQHGALVEVSSPIEFKAGEIVGLGDEQAGYLAQPLEPMTA